MARYRLKRKVYSNVIVDAARNTLGGVTEGVGKALDNKAAGVIGGVVGASKLGGTIGGTIGSILGGGPIGGTIGTALGMGAGYLLGSGATRGLGKGLKYAGQDMQTA